MLRIRVKRSFAILPLLCGVALVASAVDAAPKSSPADGITLFEKQVWPLLSSRCVSCHSAEKQKGGLRLDSRAALLKGGDTGPALVPGKTKESLLLQAVRHDHDQLQMPP